MPSNLVTSFDLCLRKEKERVFRSLVLKKLMKEMMRWGYGVSELPSTAPGPGRHWRPIFDLRSPDVSKLVLHSDDRQYMRK